MGGGGLVSGVSVAVKASRGDRVRVVGVEPEGAPKMTASRAAGRPVTLEKTASIADGLLSIRPGDFTFAHVQRLVDEIITVSDDEIARAVKWLFDHANVVAEPSGAASVAAVLRLREAAAGTVAIVSGGNVAPEDYAKYIS
jgi:threonine dehydratase